MIQSDYIVSWWSSIYIIIWVALLTFWLKPTTILQFINLSLRITALIRPFPMDFEFWWTVECVKKFCVGLLHTHNVLICSILFWFGTCRFCLVLSETLIVSRTVQQGLVFEPGQFSFLAKLRKIDHKLIFLSGYVHLHAVCFIRDRL